MPWALFSLRSHNGIESAQRIVIERKSLHEPQVIAVRADGHVLMTQRGITSLDDGDDVAGGRLRHLVRTQEFQGNAWTNLSW